MSTPARPATVRPLLPQEVDAVHAMNQAEVPHVGDVTRQRLVDVLTWSDVALAAERDGALIGFVVAMGAGSGYDSVNYRWFVDRYDELLYVDRIVVAEAARGRGVARALYDAAVAAHPAPLLTAEVNVEPPNPGSMAFHRRYGFTEVGRVDHGPGSVVAMLVHETGVAAPGD